MCGSKRGMHVSRGVTFETEARTHQAAKVEEELKRTGRRANQMDKVREVSNIRRRRQAENGDHVVMEHRSWMQNDLRNMVAGDGYDRRTTRE